MSQKSKPNYIVNLLLSILFSTLVVILVFAFTYSISYLNYKNSVSKENVMINLISNFESMDKNITCDETFLLNISKDLDSVATKISLLEKRWGKDDPRVIEQKRLYSEIEYGHFKIIQDINKKCSTNYTIFLFFYSNIPPADKDSENIGFMLDYFKKLNSNVMIYSFDYDINSTLINNMKSEYNVDFVPSIVNVKNKKVFVVYNAKEFGNQIDY